MDHDTLSIGGPGGGTQQSTDCGDLSFPSLPEPSPRRGGGGGAVTVRQLVRSSCAPTLYIHTPRCLSGWGGVSSRRHL